jgi:hypothetical protein
MRSRLILKPGQRGTKKLCAEYGERLLFDRYGYDEKRRKRFKAVELVVDEIDWEPQGRKMRGDTVVGLRVDWQEMELRHTVKTAGGRWNRVRRLWELRYDRVVGPGLEGRSIRDLDD